jgi:putative transposase
LRRAHQTKPQYGALCLSIAEPKATCSFSRLSSPSGRATCSWIGSTVYDRPIGRFNIAAHLKRSRFCILPDHIHAVWALPENDADFSMRWSLIKSGFSRGLDAQPRSKSKVLKREKGIWQRRYWEHAIRNDADLERHVDYIHFNPVKHGYVTRVADWPHSSFHRYVEQGLLVSDWGGDMKEIQGAFGE